MFRVTLLSLVYLLSLSAFPGEAADKDVRNNQDLFEISVRPVLVGHCIKCHGDAKQEGALRLTTREELLRGGDSGAAIVPGKPEESLLLQALRYESFEMPPEGPLNEELIAGIEQWIAAGAPWPAGTVLQPVSKLTPDDRAWWCLQPIRDPVVPTVDDHGWCRNEIDHFIFDRLAKAGVQPAEAAEPRVLKRRLNYAITGLPPEGTPSESESGIDLEQLMGQLLESPAYGVNQARMWLDLVRYADSDGYNADHERPEAAHYRDYVVRSFNADKPYDRFVTEQLAGDEIDPGDRDALIATMYLRHWIYEWNQRDVEGQWAEILNDINETTADVFLGLSLKCARCHDHKFDPLLQKDYYKLLAFFAPLLPREDQPIADIETRTQWFQKQRAWEEATDEIRRRLHDIETPALLKNATREGTVKFVAEIAAMLSKRIEDRLPYEHQIASLASRQFDVHPEKLPEWLDAEANTEREKLLSQLAEFNNLKPAPLPTIKFVVSDVGPIAPPTYVLDDKSKQPVEPGFPTILDDHPAMIVPPPGALQSTGRRTALARWLTDSTNPLIARVIVNRIWAQHFGRGLVETVNDFGHLGTPPSHPELMDWLATRFIEDGWSLKKLHRRILSSATWQQRSDRQMDTSLRELDPGNVLLWKMNPRRLSGEEIVDSLLSTSGELSSEQRALYRPVRRNKPDPQLGLFDFPDRIRSQGQRHQTTTSSQALMLLNNDWMQDRAKALAKLLDELDDQALVQRAYGRLYFRDADSNEVAMAHRFLLDYEAATPPEKAPSLLGRLPDGRAAIDLQPQQATSIQIPIAQDLLAGDITIEATVLLRSLYPDASVRTIVAQWSGNQRQPGWSLGVTSTKSAFKPRNLILQLVGVGEQGELAYEVVASNLHLELNKPYHVAVSIDLDNATDDGVTFYVRERSDLNAAPQIARVSHKALRGIRPERPIEIGGRSRNHQWDGLIQNVRLHDAALSVEELTSGQNEHLVLETRFDADDRLGVDASGHQHHAVVDSQGLIVITPKQRARVALLHALLNSNEMIYVD